MISYCSYSAQHLCVPSFRSYFEHKDPPLISLDADLLETAHAAHKTNRTNKSLTEYVYPHQTSVALAPSVFRRLHQTIPRDNANDSSSTHSIAHTVGIFWGSTSVPHCPGDQAHGLEQRSYEDNGGLLTLLGDSVLLLTEWTRTLGPKPSAPTM